MFKPTTGAKTKHLIAKAALQNHRQAFEDVDAKLSKKERKAAENRTVKQVGGCFDEEI